MVEYASGCTGRADEGVHVVVAVPENEARYGCDLPASPHLSLQIPFLICS
jgi:hypothetical protein